MAGRDDGAVRLTGRFDSTTAGPVRERLHAAARAGDGLLVVDLSTVDSVDATALGVLVGTQRVAERLGRPMALRGASPRLARLLRVTRLNRVLPLVPGAVPDGAGAVSRPPGRGAPARRRSPDLRSAA